MKLNSMNPIQLSVGAGAVIIKDGKTLLAKRKGSHAEGTWGSFGGHVEPGESPMDAVKREAKEELGIEIGNVRFASCSNIIKYGKQYVDVSFVAEILSGEPTIQEPDRISELAWFSIAALPEPLFEPVRIVFDALRSGEAYTEVRE